MANGTNQSPTRKTSSECLAEAGSEYGWELGADFGLAALSFTPIGAGAKIGLSFGLAAISTYSAIHNGSAFGAFVPNFGAQASVVDVAAAQPGFQYGERIIAGARIFAGLSVGRDIANFAQKYNSCMAGK